MGTTKARAALLAGIALGSSALAQTGGPVSKPAADNAMVDWGGGFHTGPDSITTTSMFAANGRTGVAVAAPTSEIAQRCVGLASLATTMGSRNALKDKLAQLPEAPTDVLRAEIVPAERDVPEFCRAYGVVAPNIGIEVSMPTKNWNGRFMHYGCGGGCGLVYRPQLEEPLARGYAVVASDLGHNSASNSNVYRYANLQGVIDFSYRATHVSTKAAKEIVAAFYGKQPSHSYYMGCSTGGVQGVIEAQRYPYDFDGILAGAPAYSAGPSYLEWTARVSTGPDGKPLLDHRKLPMVRKAVLAACDGLDGLKDGILQNPMQCKWKPEAIACAKGEAVSATCLSPVEVDVLRKIYAGPMDSQGHSLSYGPGGLAMGSEYGWSPTLVGTEQAPPRWYPATANNYGFGVYPIAAANAGKMYDYDVDPRQGDIFYGGETLGWLRYAGNPDLRRFRDAGGKLIIYHGWDDNEVAPGASVDYYETVTRTMGGLSATQAFARLFMIPAMGHCRRGPGGDAGDFITAMENWVEKGQAPAEIVMHHLKVEQNYLGLPRPRYPLPEGSFDRARPVYPFPQIALYKGKGDPALPTSWKPSKLQ